MPEVYSIPWVCGKVYTRLKEQQWHIYLEYLDTSSVAGTVSTWSTASSYATLPPPPPNPDTWIASSGRWIRLSFIPTAWTGRMTSLWASHGNLSSAPWNVVGSLHHMIEELDSLLGHADPATLPLSGHKLCPLQALTSLYPKVLASFHYLCFLIPRHMPATHSLHISSLPNTPLCFFLSSS
jgi:hypothetical protein